MPETSSPSIPAGAAPAPGYRVSIAVAAVLFLLDFFLFQGFLAVYCAAYVVLWGVPQALSAWRKSALRKSWLIRAAAYGCAAVAMAGIVTLNRALAVRGAEEIVAAVENFHAAEHRYPEQLEELVPRFLDRLPRGDVRPYGTVYRYWGEGAARYVSYSMPPWPVLRIYDFRTRQWRIND